jgi:hypothetical protein
MAKFLASLLFLLVTSNAQANCYAGSWVNGMPVYGSLFVDGGTSLAQCQALACQIYPSISQSCPQAAPICTSTFIEKTESCPPNYSGARRSKQETKTCNDGTVTQFPWQLFSDTCVLNPPSCQITSQQQTLSCQTGYTGIITQTRTSTCPNPYSQAVMGDWITTTNTCVKSVTNPTNVMSPVSPVSPANPTSVVNQSSNISAQITPSSVATVQIPSFALNSPATTDGSNALSQGSSALSSTAQVDAKGKVKSVVGLVLSLETIVKPMMTQPSVFSEPQLVQGLPNEVLFSNQLFLDVYGQSFYNQTDKLKQIIKDGVELEQ